MMKDVKFDLNQILDILRFVHMLHSTTRTMGKHHSHTHPPLTKKTQDNINDL